MFSRLKYIVTSDDSASLFIFQHLKLQNTSRRRLEFCLINFYIKYVHSYAFNRYHCKYFLVSNQGTIEVQNDMRGTENWRMCPSPDSPRKPVKSTAVVKYSSVQSYANFALLQCNTDLNLPPSNWLTSSAESYGLQYEPSNSSGFSRYVSAPRVDSVAFLSVLKYPHNKTAKFEWRLSIEDCC